MPLLARSLRPFNYLVGMTPKLKPIKVLALAPGKREFGLAVFTGIELTYFLLKSFRKTRPEPVLINEVVTLTRELIESYHPGIIAIRAISKYQQTSSFLKQVRKALKHEAAINKVPYTEVTLNQILSRYGNNKNATKKDAFRDLVRLYPELNQFMDRPNYWQDKYYNNLFMAVAVGVFLLKTQNQKPLLGQ